MVDAALAIINAAKSVGIFVRNHGWLRKEVEFVPQEEVITRWLSKLKMISSVLRIIQKLNELKNTEHRTKMTQEFLENLRIITRNLDELQNIQKVLTIFYECVLFFQQEHQPTIHLVWPKIFEIQKSLRALLTEQPFVDSEISSAIVRSAQKCLLRKLDEGFLTDLHKAGTFLAPKRRLLNGLQHPSRILEKK